MTNYNLLTAQLSALSDGIGYDITILSNAASLIYNTLTDINWAGFYLFRGGELLLGPFMGKPACTRIALGRGVCGAAALEGRSVLVEDVHQFPGHIACDSASRSELVIPVYRDGIRDLAHFYGVLDLDSPSVARFTKEDQEGFEEFVKALGSFLQ